MDNYGLQWTYTTGNRWGQCSDGTQGLGCGPQEMFRACSDVSIIPSRSGGSVTTYKTEIDEDGLTCIYLYFIEIYRSLPTSTTSLPVTSPKVSTAAPKLIQRIIQPVKTITQDIKCSRYIAAANQTSTPELIGWCNKNCPVGFCPLEYCACANP